MYPANERMINRIPLANPIGAKIFIADFRPLIKLESLSIYRLTGFFHPLKHFIPELIREAVFLTIVIFIPQNI